MSLQNSYVEVPTPNTSECDHMGGRAVKEVIKVK